MGLSNLTGHLCHNCGRAVTSGWHPKFAEYEFCDEACVEAYVSDMRSKFSGHMPCTDPRHLSWHSGTKYEEPECVVARIMGS